MEFTSFESYAAEMRARLKKLKDIDGPVFLAASSVQADKTERIFKRGLASDEQPIAMKYTDAYLKFKKANFPGSVTGIVNLKFSAQLQTDFATSLSKDGNAWVEGVKNKANSLKIEGLEDPNYHLYKKPIFANTKEETARFNDILAKERAKIGI